MWSSNMPTNRRERDRRSAFLPSLPSLLTGALARRWPLKRLLGLIGIAGVLTGNTAKAATVHHERHALEARVDAVRSAMSTTHEPTHYRARATAEPQWGNWGNWANAWNNWSNWPNG
jgi:hypothetical protein